MRYSIMRYSILVLIFTSLLFSSCTKDDSNYNYYTVTEAEPEAVVEEVVDYSYQAVTGIILLKEILSQVLVGAMQHPELWNAQGPTSVVVRDGCVNSDVTPNAGGDDVMTLIFDSDALCSGANDAVIQPEIDGTLTAVITAPILTAGTGDEISITLTPDFKIFNYELNITGTQEITLNYRSTNNNPGSTGGGYQVKLPVGNNVEVTDVSGGSTNGFTTTYIGNSGTIGTIETVDGFGVVPGGMEDMSGNPLTYLDNQFALVLAEMEVDCTNNASETTKFCVDVTSGNQSLLFQPFACGCITDGVIRFRDITDGGGCSTASGSNNSNATTTVFDFGYDATESDSGICDDVVRQKIEGGSPTYPTLLSCTP